MKTKLYQLLIALAAICLASPADAQEYTLPEHFDGYYMLGNVATGENLEAVQKYELWTNKYNSSNAGSAFRLVSERPFLFAEEMEKLQALLDSGAITEQEFTALFMNLMNVSSWKSGFYPVRNLETQGADYMDMIRKLPEYVDKAMEYFLENEVEGLYNDHYSTLLLLCVFASDIITPTDLESADTFKAWVTRYLTQWRKVMDFGIYLSPIYETVELSDEETAMYPNGEFHIVFTTPKYVGNMEKAQTYINSMLEQEGGGHLDIWGSAKQMILDQIAIDHPKGSDAYDLIDYLLGDSQPNTVYMIGVDEDYCLYTQACPDAFNTQNITLTAEDIARCSWTLDAIDEEMPLALPWTRMTKDSDGRYVTTYYSSFPYRLVSEGMKAYYAIDVNYDDGIPTLVEITGDIPAYTGVIIKSEGNDYKSNKILPLLADIDRIEGNVLDGVLFATENSGSMSVYADHSGIMSFVAGPAKIAANTAYYAGSTASVGMASAKSGHEVYDILGRRISSDKALKGIYVVDGKKIIK